MAAGETKVSVMTFLADVPDDAFFYISKPGVSTPYKTTKSAFLASISGITPYATFQFLRKGFGNTGAIGEAGDIYQGWVSDGVYCPFAVYDGSGSLDNPASFEIKTTIE